MKGFIPGFLGLTSRTGFATATSELPRRIAVSYPKSSDKPNSALVDLPTRHFRVGKEWEELDS